MSRVICLLTPHSIMARWWKHFSQLLNVHGVNDVSHTEIHAAEPLVPEPNAFDVELATEKLKTHKSAVLVKSRQNWLKQGERQLALLSINLSILLRIRRNCLRSGRSWSLYPSVRRAIKQTVVNIEAYHICQLWTKFHPASCCQG